MKKKGTILAKAVVYLATLGVLSVCFILLPELAREEAAAHPNTTRTTLPYLIGAWIIAVPLFVALYQTHKFLGYIDKGKAFTAKSVKTLQNIKLCAIIFSALIVIGAITVISIAKVIDPREDVTPVVTIGLALTFISGVFTIFLAVLQRLLQNAIDIKSENDLTV